MIDNYELMLLSKGLRIFEGFSIREKMELLLLGHIRQYFIHDLIVVENRNNQNIYLIFEGEVSVWRKNVPVATLTRGDLFNETKIFSSRQETINVLAETHTTLLQIDRNVLLNHFEKRPERLIKKFVLNMLNILFGKIEKYEEEIVNAYVKINQVQENEYR